MFKDTSDYIKGAILINFLSFITLPIYTRYLTPEDFGIIALSFIFGQITASIFSFGLSNATTRFFFEYKEKNQLDNFKSLNTTNLIFQVFNPTQGIFGCVQFTLRRAVFVTLTKTRYGERLFNNFS